MAECKDCGRKVGFFEQVDARCPQCHARNLRLRNLTAEHGPQKAAEMIRLQTAEQSQNDQAIASVILTTEAVAPFEITERIDIVTAECAYGMNIFKDLFAGVRDVVGGRSKAVQNTMRDARKTALHELRREAYEIGANAVVGVDLDYVELSGAGSMVMLVASGTAVKANLEM